MRADHPLALRMAQQTLADRARVVIRRTQLAGEGLIVVDERLLSEVQRELRAVKADGVGRPRTRCF
jgi:hypothetical protein